MKTVNILARNGIYLENPETVAINPLLITKVCSDKDLFAIINYNVDYRLNTRQIPTKIDISYEQLLLLTPNISWLEFDQIIENGNTLTVSYNEECILLARDARLTASGELGEVTEIKIVDGKISGNNIFVLGSLLANVNPSDTEPDIDNALLSEDGLYALMSEDGTYLLIPEDTDITDALLTEDGLNYFITEDEQNYITI